MYGFITADKRFKELDMPLQIDIILSFFMHCYHLGDWLRNSGVDEDAINRFIHDTYELQVCRNLTNSTKHLENRNPSPPELFSFKEAGLPSPIARTYDPFGKYLGGESEHLVILVDGREINCYDFMAQCLEKWKTFLTTKGLHF